MYDFSGQAGSQKPKRKSIRRTGIVALPSLLTAMALFSGFYSIIHTIKTMATDGEDFLAAGLAIIIAAFLDGLDGRVARLMKVESDFGFQFDSIADVVSFGVAPAVLAYAAYLHPLERWGWLGAFLFLACAGIRLARFNVISNSSIERKYFKGLSSPVAAGGIALTVVVNHPFLGLGFQIFILSFTVFLALLMVSNVRFRSFKKLDSAKERPIRTLLVIMGLLVLVFSFQELALLAFFLVYLLWGIVEEIVLFRRRRKSDPNVPFVPFGDRQDSEDSLL